MSEPGRETTSDIPARMDRLPAGFAFFRFLTGAGIGGEDSAIDEMIPARVRGRVDLAINGGYWLGAAAGSRSTLVLLDPRYIPLNLGWRLGFGIGIGAAIGLIIILTHGRQEEANRVVAEIEHHFEEDGTKLDPVSETITIQPRNDLFFLASAASSSASLTVSEVFPLEMRGMAIALFHALGTGIGGTAAPGLFGRTVMAGSRFPLFHGSLFASSLLVVAVIFGVIAEGKSLESVTDPLSKGAVSRVNRDRSC